MGLSKIPQRSEEACWMERISLQSGAVTDIMNKNMKED
jgi:hypothetical protein